MTYKLNDGAVQLEVPTEPSPPKVGDDRYTIQYLECTDMGLNDTACSGPWHVLDRWLGRIVGFETSGEARGCIEDWEEDVLIGKP